MLQSTEVSLILSHIRETITAIRSRGVAAYWHLHFLWNVAAAHKGSLPQCIICSVNVYLSQYE